MARSSPPEAVGNAYVGMTPTQFWAPQSVRSQSRLDGFLNLCREFSLKCLNTFPKDDDARPLSDDDWCFATQKHFSIGRKRIIDYMLVSSSDLQHSCSSRASCDVKVNNSSSFQFDTSAVSLKEEMATDHFPIGMIGKLGHTQVDARIVLWGKLRIRNIGQSQGRN